MICSQEYVDRLREHRKKIPSLKRLISMEEEMKEADVSFSDALKTGREALLAGSQSFDKVELSGDDLAVILFTSGTTGSSKAVMLTHGNIVANVMATSQHVSIGGGVLLSVLPLHHTYECMGGFLLALYQGCTVCHAENLRRIPENLQETKATVMLVYPFFLNACTGVLKAESRRRERVRFGWPKGLLRFPSDFSD